MIAKGSALKKLRDADTLYAMSTVQDIKNAIEKLPEADFWKLSEWLIQRHSDQWDRQIEDDIRNGKLDKFAEEALREHREGKSRPFPE